ncbi:MAG: hypothetical protein J6Z36_02270 [Clostridia bacterium]|nr:hypothetical protein [Clostridia bacterium]
MEKILVTDAVKESRRVAYIYNALAARLPADVRPRVLTGETRLAIALDERALTPAVRALTANILAETVAVGCKYNYLSARLKTSRLTKEEGQIFLCALIAADLAADKRYVLSALKRVDECALDGFFAFRMSALRAKWDKIISYVPADFSPFELERFMKYLVDGNAGRVYIKEGEVYDSSYRLCRRARLTGGDFLTTETEVLLSGAGEVHVAGKLEGQTAAFLRKYYGKGAFFY